MLLAFDQQLNPVNSSTFWTLAISTFLAGLPVLVLFWGLVAKRWLAPKAGAVGALVAIAIAVGVYGMPADKAGMSFLFGAAFGLLPVGWTIFNAMLLYNITVEMGYFSIVRRSVAGLSGDARIQAILIGFSFGAFLEGAAGGGTPVAICGAIMVGLGFDPFLAAVLCLIANTSPVAYGGLGTPLIVLGGVTGLETKTLSTMAGHQLPFLSVIVPIYMVRCMCNWRQTFEVMPALIVAGGSFAVFQFVFATLHEYTPLELYPMTDIGGGIFSLIVTAVFLRFWKPKTEFRYETPSAIPAPTRSLAASKDPHAAEAAALLRAPVREINIPLSKSNIALAWAPYGLMALFLLLTGFVRQLEEKQQSEGPGAVGIGAFATNYRIAVPTLHLTCVRDKELREPYTLTKDSIAALKSDNVPTATVENLKALKPNKFSDKQLLLDKAEEFLSEEEGLDEKQRKEHLQTIEAKIAEVTDMEKALFNFPWLTAPGTAVLFAALVSMVMLRMNGRQIINVVRRTVIQMKIPIPTIACMLGLSYVTRYSGMDATLGYAFAQTGAVYPFFAAMLGWLGVFLTGTDAGSNALFGSLQKITATKVYASGAFASSGLTVTQAQILICTANSTGGVMGKMIDAQSICVATAATNQLGKEADIFKAVLWHSVVLAAVVGIMTVIQAYVPPFTKMVPKPPPQTIATE